MFWEIVPIGLLGLVNLIFALKISRGNLNPINRYRRANLRDEHREVFADLYAKGYFLIGIGCISAGLFIYLDRIIGFLISIILPFALAMLYFHRAEKNYNSPKIN